MARHTPQPQLDLFAPLARLCRRRAKPFPVAAAPPGVGAAVVSPAIAAVARCLPSRLYLGTSSWAFPGWQGLVYDRAASASTLARHGLAAYAQHPLLRTVTPGHRDAVPRRAGRGPASIRRRQQQGGRLGTMYSSQAGYVSRADNISYIDSVISVDSGIQ